MDYNPLIDSLVNKDNIYDNRNILTTLGLLYSPSACYLLNIY
jgi:hypothetical protein